MLFGFILTISLFPLSAFSTEAGAGERVGDSERETEMDGGTAEGEPEERSTDTSQTDGNTQ